MRIKTEERVSKSFNAGMIFMGGIIFMTLTLLNLGLGLQFGHAGFWDYLFMGITGLVLTIVGGFVGWFYSKPVR